MTCQRDAARMESNEIKYFVEAALLAAGRPLSVDHLQKLFDGRMAPEKSEIRDAIASLNDDYELRGILVAEVASGFRIQIRPRMANQLQKLWEERPPRYSRALFETLALCCWYLSGHLAIVGQRAACATRGSSNP